MDKPTNRQCRNTRTPWAIRSTDKAAHIAGLTELGWADAMACIGARRNQVHEDIVKKLHVHDCTSVRKDQKALTWIAN